MRSPRRILFLDRDGTLNEETPDEKVDSLAKIRLMPGVVAALLDLRNAGFTFVMVTNQDGLGTPHLPHAAFEEAHRFILALFKSQGIEFEAVCICPHFKHQDCACRKPKIGMLQKFLAANEIDRRQSFMIGDRDTDMEFAANLGVTGFAIRSHGELDETWPRIAARILDECRDPAQAAR
jgi:imidazoleglycerol-phosphate dehydratase / histidinol-phosphatase